MVPATPFRASTSCAYSFILNVSSRTQNGHSRLFPGVQYHTSLTILLGSGAGSIDGCSSGSLMGRLTLNALGSGPAGPSLGGYLASGFTRTAAPAESSGQPSGRQ